MTFLYKRDCECRMVFLNADTKMKKYKNSNQPESNQRPKDNYRTLQSSALPAELWLVLTTCEPMTLNYGPVP